MMLLFREMTLKKLRIITISVFFGFSVGFFLNPAPGGAARNTTYEKLGIFSRALSYIQNNYVDEVDATDLIYNAVGGMVSGLDEHSAFLSPDEYESMRIDTGGEFGGLGIEITLEQGRLVVVSLVDTGPAFRAGIMTGDVIVSIDGSDTRGMEPGEAATRMRGSPGSRVLLSIDRAGFSKPMEIGITRERIRLNPVTGRIVEGFVVVGIRNFQENTRDYLTESMKRLGNDSGEKIRGLVLDLRRNPGGLLDQAVAVADIWIDEGVIVKTKGRGGIEDIQRAKKAGTEPDYPMVVLIDSGSASASEIVAGALQDHGRAVLMGTPSYGKGSVQTLIELDDGSGLKLTVARYYTPSGKAIGKGGIHPEIIVDKQDKKKSEDYEASLKKIYEDDLLLMEAINFLKKRIDEEASN